MKLISDKIHKKLIDLYGLCFIGNSICDNIASQLDVKFVMPNTSNIVHHHIAHILPVLADVISDYASDRNIYLHRNSIPKQDTEYSTITPMFNKLLEYMVDLEKQVCIVIKDTSDENDEQTKKMLTDFLKKIRPLTSMCLSFVDYIDANGDTPKDRMDMDFRINKFMKIGDD